MTEITDDVLVVSRSIKQAFEQHGGPGSAVNATANPFFVALAGSFDLLKTAQLVVDNLDTHRKLKAQAQAEAELRNKAIAAQRAVSDTLP